MKRFVSAARLMHAPSARGRSTSSLGPKAMNNSPRQRSAFLATADLRDIARPAVRSTTVLRELATVRALGANRARRRTSLRASNCTAHCSVVPPSLLMTSLTFGCTSNGSSSSTLKYTGPDSLREVLPEWRPGLSPPRSVEVCDSVGGSGFVRSLSKGRSCLSDCPLSLRQGLRLGLRDGSFTASSCATLSGCCGAEANRRGGVRGMPDFLTGGVSSGGCECGRAVMELRGVFGPDLGEGRVLGASLCRPLSGEEAGPLL
mmetsp:Transcript_35983/g.95508  ORF Transcript_35983/g.95508 Transcript_35983/m.95508 type:complete len:260 (-) Transcript_35983:584-1363(-)